ncbi:MAG: metallophosphatase family protein [Lachnospiraceae bacterium]|nr:metallophosphatase family protein [Lachnospiraceae bacterium]
MKYAVISDIHGNYPALKAVLEDAKRQGISACLFAGDYCISGAWPNECVEAIRAIPDKHVVRGNEEKYLEDLIGKDQSSWTDGQMQVSYWCYRTLSRDNLDYLLRQPHAAEFACNGVKIRMAHSSVDFLGTYPFYTWNSVTVADKIRQSDDPPEAILSGFAAERENDGTFREAVSKLEKGVYVFGHSHVQWHYADKEAGVYLINPGSCGLPLDGIRDSMPYTILEIGGDGQISFEEKRVLFDKKNYIHSLRQSSQYREANIWSRVIMEELTTAREHMYYFLSFVKQHAEKIGDERRPYVLETWESAYENWKLPEAR